MIKFKFANLVKNSKGSLEILYPNVYYNGKCLGTILGEDVFCSDFENLETLRELQIFDSKPVFVFQFEDLAKHAEKLQESKIQFKPIAGDFNQVECAGHLTGEHTVEVCIRYLTKFLKIPYKPIVLEA